MTLMSMSFLTETRHFTNPDIRDTPLRLFLQASMLSSDSDTGDEDNKEVRGQLHERSIYIVTHSPRYSGLAESHDRDLPCSKGARVASSNDSCG